jgi:hypothetical protein
MYFRNDRTFGVISTLFDNSIRLSGVFFRPNPSLIPYALPIFFGNDNLLALLTIASCSQHEAKKKGTEKKRQSSPLPTQLCNTYEIGVIYHLIQTHARLPVSQQRQPLRFSALNLTVFLLVQTNENDVFRPSCSLRPAWPSSAPGSPWSGRRHRGRTWRSLAS